MAGRPDRSVRSFETAAYRLVLLRWGDKDQRNRTVGEQSKGKRIGLARRGQGIPLWADQLPLTDQLHRLDPGNDNSRAPLALEPHHRPHDAFDRSVALFDDVVQTLRLAKDDLSIAFGGVVTYGGGIPQPGFSIVAPAY
jgi:hypothetical protein